MTLRKILHFPNPKLRLKANKVQKIDDDIQTLINDMLETMYEDNGIGLAAIQIDIQHHIFIIDISEDRKQPYVFINAEIIETSGKQKMQEGCLSVPGIYESVERANHVKIKALDRQGKTIELEANDLLAACVQHELDHLEGKLFIDRLSSLKKQFVKRKLRKLHKTTL